MKKHNQIKPNFRKKLTDQLWFKIEYDLWVKTFMKLEGRLWKELSIIKLEDQLRDEL